jgi:hypothetical protein
MGNAIAAIHWSRRYKGETRQTFYEDDLAASQAQTCSKALDGPALSDSAEQP